MEGTSDKTLDLSMRASRRLQLNKYFAAPFLHECRMYKMDSLIQWPLWNLWIKMCTLVWLPHSGVICMFKTSTINASSFLRYGFTMPMRNLLRSFIIIIIINSIFTAVCRVNHQSLSNHWEWSMVTLKRLKRIMVSAEDLLSFTSYNFCNYTVDSVWIMDKQQTKNTNNFLEAAISSQQDIQISLAEIHHRCKGQRTKSQ